MGVDGEIVSPEVLEFECLCQSLIVLTPLATRRFSTTASQGDGLDEETVEELPAP
ncbi:MAG: hypothetical protein AAFO87_10440 [Cyanobacteria bacterium J06607_6]